MNESRREQLKSLLKETITLMCKSVTYEEDLRVEALIGVTIDNREVILVGFNELLSQESESDVKSKRDVESKKHTPSGEITKSSQKERNNSKHGEKDTTKQTKCSGYSLNESSRQLKLEQVDDQNKNDVIICEDDPSLRQHTENKPGGRKRMKKSEKDDDLIYVGKESYSLVTGNFVKQEQHSEHPSATLYKKKQRTNNSRSKPDQVQTTNHVAVTRCGPIPKLQEILTTTEPCVSAVSRKQKNVKRRNNTKHGRTENHDFPKSVPVRLMGQNHYPALQSIVQSMPTVSPILIAPTSISAARIPSQVISSHFVTQETSVAMSMPHVREATHVTWSVTPDQTLTPSVPLSSHRGVNKITLFRGRTQVEQTASPNVSASGSAPDFVGESSLPSEVVPVDMSTSVSYAPLLPTVINVPHRSSCSPTPSEVFSPDTVPDDVSQMISLSSSVLPSNVVPANVTTADAQTMPITTSTPNGQVISVTSSATDSQMLQQQLSEVNYQQSVETKQSKKSPKAVQMCNTCGTKCRGSGALKRHIQKYHII